MRCTPRRKKHILDINKEKVLSRDLHHKDLSPPCFSCPLLPHPSRHSYSSRRSADLNFPFSRSSIVTAIVNIPIFLSFQHNLSPPFLVSPLLLLLLLFEGKNDSSVSGPKAERRFVFVLAFAAFPDVNVVDWCCPSFLYIYIYIDDSFTEERPWKFIESKIEDRVHENSVMEGWRVICDDHVFRREMLSS